MTVQAGAPIPEIKLFDEPAEGILILGLLRHDTGVLATMLNRLPTDMAGYRGNLRVLLSTLRGMQQRVVKLLGEEES